MTRSEGEVHGHHVRDRRDEHPVTRAALRRRLLLRASWPSSLAYALFKAGKALERVDKVLADVDENGIPLMQKAGDDARRRQRQPRQRRRDHQGRRRHHRQDRQHGQRRRGRRDDAGAQGGRLQRRRAVAPCPASCGATRARADAGAAAGWSYGRAADARAPALRPPPRPPRTPPRRSAAAAARGRRATVGR